MSQSSWAAPQSYPGSTGNARHTLMIATARAQAPVVVGVVELHRPKRAPQRGLPVCHGCDKADAGLADPEWPCRTFATLAKDLLDITNVEDHLERLKTH